MNEEPYSEGVLEIEDDDFEDEPDHRVRSVLLTLLVMIVGVAVAVGVGSWVVVRSLGLDEPTIEGAGPVRVDPVAPLPTTALPQPSDSLTFEPSPDGLVATGVPAALSGDLALSASPVTVAPGERINLTGRWPGKDAVELKVQRKIDGQWTDFGVQTQVHVGTFATYVITSRTGEQIFRVLDPESGTASNEVAVVVG